MVGRIELSKGLNSKLKAIAPPTRESNSKDNPREAPKNIFLPNVTSLVEPNMNNIANRIIATNVAGLTNLL